MTEPLNLENLISELPDRPSPAGWQDRVHAAIAAGVPVSDIGPDADIGSRSAWRPYWIAGGMALAVAAGLAIYIMGATHGPDGARRPTIVVKTQPREPMAGAATASVGDTVLITAEGAGELRVYRAGALVARCPGDAACRSSAHGFELSFLVTARGALSAIAFKVALPAAVGGSTSAATLDGDIDIAARVNSQMTLSDLIEVP